MMDITPFVPRFILNDRIGYAMAKALEAGINYMLDVAALGRNTLYNVDEMPEWRLDELASEYNVPYDFSASVDVKRSVIRNVGYLSRMIGTASGLETYLSGIYPGVQAEPGTMPFTFFVYLPEGAGDNEAWLSFVLSHYKMARDNAVPSAVLGEQLPMAGTLVAGQEIDWLTAATQTSE